MQQFLGNFFVTGFWVVAAGVFGWLVYRYRQILLQPEKQNFKDLQASLIGKSSFEDVYENRLKQLLGWVDRVFGGKSHKFDETYYQPEWLHRLLCWLYWRPYTYRRLDETRSIDWQAPAWSVASYDRCLLLAVVYPMLAAVLGWFWFGDGGELGAALRFTPTDDGAFRLATFGLVATSTSLFVLFLRTERWVKWLFLGAAMLVFYFGNSMLRDFFTEAPLVAFAVAFAVAVAVAGAVAVAVAVAGAVAGAVAFAVAFAVAYKRENQTIVSVSILYFTAAFCIFWFVSSENTSSSTFALVVGLTLLPLVNAPFDWASIGLTRWLLRKNLATDNGLLRLGFSLADFFGALILLVLLAVTLLFALEAANFLVLRNGQPQPLIDLGVFLRDIRDEPDAGRHFWVYFALFSTLLPTLLHAFIWVFSLITTRIPILHGWLANAVEHRLQEGAGTLELAALLLAARWVVSFMMTFFGALVLTYGFFVITGFGLDFVNLLIGFHDWLTATLFEF